MCWNEQKPTVKKERKKTNVYLCAQLSSSFNRLPLTLNQHFASTFLELSRRWAGECVRGAYTSIILFSIPFVCWFRWQIESCSRNFISIRSSLLFFPAPFWFGSSGAIFEFGNRREICSQSITLCLASFSIFQAKIRLCSSHTLDCQFFLGRFVSTVFGENSKCKMMKRKHCACEKNEKLTNNVWIAVQMNGNLLGCVCGGKVYLMPMIAKCGEDFESKCRVVHSVMHI